MAVPIQRGAFGDGEFGGDAGKAEALGAEVRGGTTWSLYLFAGVSSSREAHAVSGWGRVGWGGKRVSSSFQVVSSSCCKGLRDRWLRWLSHEMRGAAGATKRRD